VEFCLQLKRGVIVSINTIKSWTKAVFVLFCYVSVLFYGTSFADGETLGDVASNITDSFSDLTDMITAGAYIAGIAFAIGAILKFKAHKDNPTQIPVGTPIALLFVAAALIFLPSIFSVTGETIFNSSGSTAGVTGITSF